MVRVVLPHHLRLLANVSGEISVEIVGRPTFASLLDALEMRHPALKGTIRDAATGGRRPLVRFFACEEDVSHAQPDAALPESVARGIDPLYIVGAIAGG